MSEKFPIMSLIRGRNQGAYMPQQKVDYSEREVMACFDEFKGHPILVFYYKYKTGQTEDIIRFGEVKAKILLSNTELIHQFISHCEGKRESKKNQSLPQNTFVAKGE